MSGFSRRTRLAVWGWLVIVAVCVYLWSIHVEPGYFVRNFLAHLYTDFQDLPLRIPYHNSLPGMKPFLITLHLVTGIPLADLAYIPLGAFLRAALYFALIWSFTKRKLAAVAGALMTTVYPWAGWGYSNVYVHSLGAPLFLTAVLIANISIRDDARFAHFLMGVAVIIGVDFLDYTSEVWAIVFFAVVGGWETLRGSRKKNRSISYFLVAIVGSVLFWNKNISIGFVNKITTFNPLSVFSGSETHSYAYQYQPSGNGLSTSSYFYAFVLGVLGIYGILLAYQTLRIRRLDLSNEEIIIGIMAIAGVGTTGIYTLMGRFSQFFIFIGFPLIAICCIHFFVSRSTIPLLQSRHLPALAAVVLLVLAGANAGALLASGQFSRTSNSAVEPGGEWVLSHTNSPTVLSGLDSRGRIRMAEVHSSNTIKWDVFTPKRYSRFVNGGTPASKYVFTDYGLEQGTQGLNNWQEFDNLRNHKESIQANENVEKVYTSGRFSVWYSRK